MGKAALAFIVLFIFSGCERPEEPYSSGNDYSRNNAAEENRGLVEYSNRRGASSRRRNSRGGGGGGGSSSSSLSVSVCQRHQAVQLAVISQLIQSQRLSRSSGDDLLSLCGDIDEDDLDSIEELRIEDDLTLSSTDFSDFENLRYLILVNAGVSEIPSGVFSSLSSLRLLNLGRNEIERLSSGAFSGLTSLQELDLSDNDIDQAGAEVFSSLSSLRDLDLSGNNLSSSDENSLRQTLSDVEIIFD